MVNFYIYKKRQKEEEKGLRYSKNSNKIIVDDDKNGNKFN